MKRHPRKGIIAGDVHDLDVLLRAGRCRSALGALLNLQASVAEASNTRTARGLKVRRGRYDLVERAAGRFSRTCVIGR